MIIYDYGGRAQDETLPHNGAVQSWDIDTQTYHDYADGGDVTRPFNDLELVRFQALLDGNWRANRIKLITKEVSHLRERSASADADFAATADKITQALAQAAQIKGSTPALTVAYVTAIRDKLGIVADALVDMLQWRQQVDVGFSALCLDVAWLGALAVDLTDDPPPPA